MMVGYGDRQKVKHFAGAEEINNDVHQLKSGQTLTKGKTSNL